MTFQEIIKAAMLRLGDSEQIAENTVRKLWLTKPMPQLKHKIPDNLAEQAIQDLSDLVAYYREHPEELDHVREKQRLRRRNQ